jgi:hypothetical protein
VSNAPPRPRRTGGGLWPLKSRCVPSTVTVFSRLDVLFSDAFDLHRRFGRPPTSDQNWDMSDFTALNLQLERA